MITWTHIYSRSPLFLSPFFFNDTATTEIYTLSLHDALPIWRKRAEHDCRATALAADEFSDGVNFISRERDDGRPARDRKSTRLNSSHMSISYAVFCLKKKKKKEKRNMILSKTSTISTTSYYE